jgi:hypothetical protein
MEGLGLFQHLSFVHSELVTHSGGKGRGLM